MIAAGDEWGERRVSTGWGAAGGGRGQGGSESEKWMGRE